MITLKNNFYTLSIIKIIIDIIFQQQIYMNKQHVFLDFLDVKQYDNCKLFIIYILKYISW